MIKNGDLISGTAGWILAYVLSNGAAKGVRS